MSLPLGPPPAASTEGFRDSLVSSQKLQCGMKGWGFFYVVLLASSNEGLQYDSIIKTERTAKDY